MTVLVAGMREKSRAHHRLMMRPMQEGPVRSAGERNATRYTSRVEQLAPNRSGWPSRSEKETAFLTRWAQQTVMGRPIGALVGHLLGSQFRAVRPACVLGSVKGRLRRNLNGFAALPLAVRIARAS